MDIYTATATLFHSPFWMGLNKGGEMALPFFELHHKSSHPRLKEGILEVDSAEPASSLGCAYLMKSIILMKSGLKEADSDAYDFFLRREKHRIHSFQAILQPLVSVTTSVALAILIPPACSLLITVATTVTVSTVSFMLIEIFYEAHLENLTICDATEKEKQGALRFCKAGGLSYSRLEKKLTGVQEVGEYEKERLAHLLEENHQKAPFENYMPTVELVKKWRHINENQPETRMPVVNAVVALSLMIGSFACLPLVATIATYPLIVPLSLYIVRPIEKRCFLDLLEKNRLAFDKDEWKELTSSLSGADLLGMRERQRALPALS